MPAAEDKVRGAVSVAPSAERDLEECRVPVADPAAVRGMAVDDGLSVYTSSRGSSSSSVTLNSPVEKPEAGKSVSGEQQMQPFQSLFSLLMLFNLGALLSLAPSNPPPKTLNLDKAIPEKKWPKLFRGLRFRILIVYRFLFSIMFLLNIGALVALALVEPSPEWLGIITAANLAVAILIRQENVINLLYRIFCSAPKWFPLWIRRYCAKIYHLGGVHSAAGVCATLWLLASTIRSTANYIFTRTVASDSLATIIVSWMLSALCCVMVIFALPGFRKRHHDTFEVLHRFLGWLALVLFWVRLVLSAHDSAPTMAEVGPILLRNPGLWLLAVATVSVASSWFLLRKVPVEVVPLSDHAVMLNFTYSFPVNGSFVRVSTRPLLEWHSFATFPQPEPSNFTSGKGYSVIISSAGDWTSACIRKPPSHLWVRGVPVCGVMHVTTLFKRVVFIATGSGIAPMLGFINAPTCPTQLLWSTPDPKSTFGQPMLDLVRRTIPDAVIHDTRTQGRPDLVTMGYNLAQEFGAEAVMVISNEKLTKKVVYGLETRGVTAFGAIWDS